MMCTLTGDVPSGVQLAIHPQPGTVESVVEHRSPKSHSSAPDLPTDTGHHWDSQVPLFATCPGSNNDNNSGVVEHPFSNEP